MKHPSAPPNLLYYQQDREATRGERCFAPDDHLYDKFALAAHTLNRARILAEDERFDEATSALEYLAGIDIAGILAEIAERKAATV